MVRTERTSVQGKRRLSLLDFAATRHSALVCGRARRGLAAYCLCQLLKKTGTAHPGSVTLLRSLGVVGFAGSLARSLLGFEERA